MGNMEMDFVLKEKEVLYKSESSYIRPLGSKFQGAYIGQFVHPHAQ